MKTYIFSNCKKSDNATYAKNLLNHVKKDDKLIILNQGNVFYKIPEFEQYKDMHIIMRSFDAHGYVGYFGLFEAWKHRKLFATLTTFYPLWKNNRIEDARLVTDYKVKGEVVDKIVRLPWMIDYFDKTKEKTPTTGYSAYYLVQDLFGVHEKDIVLVNFYGNDDNSTGKYVGHGWNFENDWLKNKNRIFL